jgi:hypothetical protein
MEKIDKNIYEGFDEKVDKFLKGMMSETEESEFKKELSANADLRQRAKAITILLKGLREKGRERDQKIIEEGHPHIKQCPAWKRIAVCACAAAIVGISTFKYIDYRHTSHLAEITAPYCTEFDKSEVLRGDIDTATVNQLAKIFQEVKTGQNLPDAVDKLEKAYVEIDNNFTYTQFANNISWYYAIALIKTDKNDKAKQVLKKIILDNQDMPIAKRAKELMKELK